jgi:hypothetical protein
MPPKPRERLFFCLVANANLLGVCALQLISRYSRSVFPFLHSLFPRFGAPEQLVAFAEMLNGGSSSAPNAKRPRRQRPESRLAAIMDFVKDALDHSAFVSALTNSAQCNAAFIQLYSAVLSISESDALAALIQNLIAVASLPSFVANLGALMNAATDSDARLRCRALQLLSDKLEQVSRERDEIAPAVDNLLPHLLMLIERDSEPDLNKQLSCLVSVVHVTSTLAIETFP